MEANDTGGFSELNTQSNSGSTENIREIAFSYMMSKLVSIAYIIASVETVILHIGFFPK